MTNEQLQEGNKLIFEVTKFNQAVERDEVPEFHNYWNQLMGAVQTIQSMGYRFLLDSNEERIVFILDVWHPDLTIPEINLIQNVMKNLITTIKSGSVIEGAPSSVLDFV